MLHPEQFFVNMTSEAYTAMLEHHDFSNETQLEMGLQHCDLTKTLDQVGDAEPKSKCSLFFLLNSSLM